MKKLIGIALFTLSLSSCGNIKTPQEIIDDIRYFGRDEVVIINNNTIYEEKGENELGIVEVIDPCGKESDYDEVLVRLSDDALMVFFAQDGGRLALIGVGKYKTTDNTNCTFEIIDNDGKLEVISE